MKVEGAVLRNQDNQSINLNGWLVLIEGKLYLLDEDLRSNYKDTPRIRIAETDIKYVLRKELSPLGGGDSFVFHEANIKGKFHAKIEPEVEVEELLVKEGGLIKKIDITALSIETAKKEFEPVLAFNFFDEMGDA